MAEGPLVQIDQLELRLRKRLERSLRKQPHEMATAFAARAALRVLPIMQTERDVYFTSGLVLPAFRAMVASWVGASYYGHETLLAPHIASALDHARWASITAIDATSSNACFVAAAAANAAHTAAAAVDRNEQMRESASYFTDLTARVTFHAAPTNRRGLLSAISIDATRVEEGQTASDITGSPLWPKGQPDQFLSLWQELKTALDAEKQDWDVWTDWYEARLRGDPAIENLEIARATVPDKIWNQGLRK